MALALAFASTAAAQLSDYLGPGVGTYGAGQIGTRSGQEVDLRFYADASGFYDHNIQPVSVDSKGNLVQADQWGTEISFGAYGSHEWRHSQLGLDYRGTFRHYSDNSYYDGIDQQLALGYTLQKSRRMYFDFTATGGTISRGLGAIAGYPIPISSLVNQPSSLLFDSRNYFGEGGSDMTYLLSARTSFSVGGQGFVARQRSNALAGVEGYVARGSLQRRWTQSTTVGVAYEHVHFAYTQAFGDSDINNYEIFTGAQLAKNWTLSARAGAYQAEAQGVQQVAADPAIAALLGITTTTETFYSQHVYPSGEAVLTRTFKRALLSTSYTKTVTPGNGVYLASRSDNAWVTYSYTALRQLSLNFFGGATRFHSLGQDLQPYWQANGGLGLSYALTRALHFTMRYDARRQEIDSSTYHPMSYRVSFGLAYSPGTVPLSLR
jgi:hypothetical protein